MPDKLKILHLVPAECEWEPAQRIAALAAGLREHGFASAVTAPDHSRLWEFAEAAGVEILPAALEPSLNPLRWLETSRLVKQFAPDLIHLHTAEAARMFSRAALFAKGIPCVATRYSLLPAPAPAEYGADVGAVVCPSRRLADVFARSGAAEDKLHVVFDGVSMAAADRALEERDQLRVKYRDAFCPGKEKPLFIANIAPLEKTGGQADILEAMTEIVAVLPQAHLFIMGEGQLRDELARIIRTTALDKDVTFLEPDRAVSRLLAASDLVVSATLDDVSGVMLQAAMAAGRAPVAYDSGCYGELFESGKTGLFAREHSAASLREAMLDLLESRTRREHLGRLAKAKAARAFDISAQAGKMAEIYEKTYAVKGQ